MRIDFIGPADQPSGTRRTLQSIRTFLNSPDYLQFRAIVAFAKQSPLIKLAPQIHAWKAKVKGRSAEVILGIDHRGTSLQALQQAMAVFDKVYIYHNALRFVTFHPKIYSFEGSKKAACIVGSSNLTTGGLETNYESSVLIDFELPAEVLEFKKIGTSYDDLVSRSPANCIRLDAKLLSVLVADGYLEDESIKKTYAGGGAALAGGTRIRIFAPTPVPPAEALPPGMFKQVKKLTKSPKPPKPGKGTSHIEPPRAEATATAPSTGIASRLAIQIVPHHNGEIFLSTLAIRQNPDFFDFPFKGLTAPKKGGNPPYPQRTPDPVVDFFVYDTRGKLKNFLSPHNLNMVFYTKKSDIRITVAPSFAKLIPAKSILVITLTDKVTTGRDYVLESYPPGGADHRRYLAACNQTLPSGGAGLGRRMGWL